MTGDYFLNFHRDNEGTLLLPHQCAISLTCYDSAEVQQSVASFIEESLYELALSGMDLRALDGVTVALDARQAAFDLQSLPDGAVSLERSDQAETMEVARTVAVRRGQEFRFHIVLRAGLGLLTLSPRAEEQAFACGCIAHEAAHVEHEGHLYRTFPQVYERILDCGDRSRQTFLKALDVWSEYAACRSSAQFRRHLAKAGVARRKGRGLPTGAKRRRPKAGLHKRSTEDWGSPLSPRDRGSAP